MSTQKLIQAIQERLKEANEQELQLILRVIRNLLEKRDEN